MIKTFNEYQTKAIGLRISLNKFLAENPNLPENVVELMGILYDSLGLGEAGEVQDKVKKIIRDNGGVVTAEAREAIKLELGDTLWYIASLAQNLGMTLEEVATANIDKLVDRTVRGVRHGSGDYR